MVVRGPGRESGGAMLRPVSPLTEMGRAETEAEALSRRQQRELVGSGVHSTSRATAGNTP